MEGKQSKHIKKKRKQDKEGNCSHPIVINDHANVTGIVRSLRDVPPAHYTLKIKSFSLFLNTKGEKYESGVFEAGDYKWKLSLHPNGNKKKKVNDHISLYLAIAETETLSLAWEVNVNFKLFVFNQFRGKYLSIQDANGEMRRFHQMKTEWGFDQFLPLKTFNDPSNGYLVDDCCIFGAEVSVIKYNGKGECVSMIKDCAEKTYTWKINHFSKINAERFFSEEFDVGEHTWLLQIYPRGYETEGKWMSLFLTLTDCETLPSEPKVYVECKLCLRDQVHGNHVEKEAGDWCCATNAGWGDAYFLSLNDLNNESKGLLVNDVVIVEVQIKLISCQF